jgi:hypothetical protein
MKTTLDEENLQPTKDEIIFAIFSAFFQYSLWKSD